MSKCLFPVNLGIKNGSKEILFHPFSLLLPRLLLKSKKGGTNGSGSRSSPPDSPPLLLSLPPSPWLPVLRGLRCRRCPLGVASTGVGGWDYRGQRRVIPPGQWVPKIAVDAYVAPNVVLAGQVTVCDGASVWNGSVLRGDLNKITVGFCSNVQERCVLHAAWLSPIGLPAETSIERYVTIRAYSLLRSCTIEPECIIGQHSILMEGSLVETNSILEVGSVLPPGRRIPTGELWAGNPARFVRKLTHEEILEIPKLAVAINDLMQSHFSEFLPYSTVYLEVEQMKKALSIPL